MQCNYSKIMEVKSLPIIFADGAQSGDGGCEVRLIDLSDITEDLRNTDASWQHEFDNF